MLKTISVNVPTNNGTESHHHETKMRSPTGRLPGKPNLPERASEAGDEPLFLNTDYAAIELRLCASLCLENGTESHRPETKCRWADQYKAMRPPRCLGGKICDVCRRKWASANYWVMPHIREIRS